MAGKERSIAPASGGSNSKDYKESKETGTPNQTKAKQDSEKSKYKVNEKVKFLKPKVVIPFASFCYFSKQDNFYMNDSVNNIESTINYLSKENPNVKCFSVDAEAEQDLCNEFNVSSIPVTLLFKDGELRETKNGILTKDQLNELIKSCG